MLLTAPWTALALFVIATTANRVLLDKSPVNLSLSRRVNFTSAHNLVRHDQARAKYLKNRRKHSNIVLRDSSEPVDNQAVSYVASIGVGSPATTYSLIVDTGSSNTWVGADTKYVKTSSSSRTINEVTVEYGSGDFFGGEYTDTVTITPSLVIPKQSIGVATTSRGFDGVDGILGIGPVDLTQDTLIPEIWETIPTVTDNLFNNGVISANAIGVYFQPTNVEEDVNGQITWGGTDDSKFTGNITFIPITTTSPASNYWGIDQSVRYGESTTILSTTAGIVDTGTTLVLLATDGFNAYKAATGAVLDQATELLTIIPDQYASLQSLFFIAGDTTFELTPNAQTWPRSLNSDIGGTASQIYLIVNDLGSSSGQGLDFINGYGFLERFYSVYDTANHRVGLATTPFTNATTN